MTAPLRTDALRPGRLSEFSGQPRLIDELGIILESAKERLDLPDHILLAGPPGLGKTTMATIIAHELGLPLVTTSGPALEKPADAVNLLSGLTQDTVLFIDEIHRMPRTVEEVCYPAMEDGKLDFIVGEGVKARSIRMELSRFVLVGATTQVGLLSAPFRDRFGFVGRLGLYDDDALAVIVMRSAALLGLDMDETAAELIATRSRGTPRIANRLLRRVRDVAQIEGSARLTFEVAEGALNRFGVDKLGLDSLGREVLRVLCEQFGGGPVGVTTLAAAVNEAPGTLEEVYEPYLMRRGLLARTPRGRMATAAAFVHLELKVPARVLIHESTEDDTIAVPSSPLHPTARGEQLMLMGESVAKPLTPPTPKPAAPAVAPAPKPFTPPPDAADALEAFLGSEPAPAAVIAGGLGRSRRYPGAVLGGGKDAGQAGEAKPKAAGSTKPSTDPAP